LNIQKHFLSSDGNRTLQTQDTSDLKMWGPKCPDTSVPAGIKVSRDTLDLGPKCLGSEVSWVRNVR